MSGESGIPHKKTLVIGLCCIGILLAIGTVHSLTNKDSMCTGAKPFVAKTTAPKPAPEEEYISKIEIKNVQVGKTVANITDILGEVKNNGDKTVDEVMVRIYFLDKNGKPISESDYRPVYFLGLGMDETDTLLKPGYVTKFDYLAARIPSDWAREVRIEVVEVGFPSDDSETND